MRKEFFWATFSLVHLHLPIAASPQQEIPLTRTFAPNQQEIGIPYLRNYAPKEYGADVQNWTIVQDQRGVMYFGNNSGVLEYDGVSWRLIPTANRSAVRSLAIGDDGKIYVGAQNEMGYLLPDSIGQLQYVSLRDSVPAEYRDFADIAKIYAMAAGVYFQALDRVFRWSNHRMQTWKPVDPFHLSFVVHDQFYIRQPGIGLLQMMGDSLRLAPDGEKFAEARIYLMLPYGEDDILIGTREQGLFLYDGALVKSFPTGIDAFLLENQIYHGAVLSNGHFALATLRGGAAIIDKAGKLQQLLNKAAGIQDDNVKFLFLDRQDGLWLALDNGLTRVEAPAPFSSYDERTGLKGAVESILKHQNMLYVATRLGVFYLQPRMLGAAGNAFVQQPRFMPVSGIAAQSWSLLSTGKTLLAATGDGIYQIQGDRATLVRESDRQSLVLLRSGIDTTRIYIGLENGLAALRFLPNSRNNWIDEGKINGIDTEIRSLVETKEGILWLGTRSQGVIRIDFSAGFSNDPTVETMDSRFGFPAEPGWVIVFSIPGEEAFVTDKGIFRFDQKKNRFFSDSTFASVHADSSRIINEVNVDHAGNVWMQAGGEVGVGRRQHDGTYRWHTTPFKRCVDFGVWSIYPEDDGTVWFGGPDGLVRYDAKVQKDYAVEFAALIRRVIIDPDSVIWDGADFSENSQSEAPVVLAYANNALRFEFAATSYDNPSANQFQYFLEGFDKSWSAWTHETKKDYTNLPEGEITFRVRARNVYGHVSREAVYAFEILPPWYRTWWAYLFYLGALALCIYGFIKYRTRQLEQRSRALEKIVQQRTEKIRQQADELQEKNAEIIKTQEQLIIQEKLASLGGLTAGIAHEIKNPLNFVNNFAELSIELVEELREEMAKQKDRMEVSVAETIDEILRDLKQNAQKINQHGKRADSIVRGMLMHSRGHTGTREATDINAMLDESVNLAYHGARAQDPSFNIKIEKDFDAGVGKVEVLPPELSRVFLNVISNACYAANQKKKTLGDSFSPTLSVRSKNLGDKIEIRVRDNGAGIPEEIRNKIFNPFFTTKPTGQGTGLGLSISYEIIVQKHKGEIKVETEEGRFTEFIIVLPREGHKT